MNDKLKQEFYKETDSLLGGTFKDHVRDGLWTWIEERISNQVQRNNEIEKTFEEKCELVLKEAFYETPIFYEYLKEIIEKAIKEQ